MSDVRVGGRANACCVGADGTKVVARHVQELVEEEGLVVMAAREVLGGAFHGGIFGICDVDMERLVFGPLVGGAI